jgi:hypothetical protein
VGAVCGRLLRLASQVSNRWLIFGMTLLGFMSSIFSKLRICLLYSLFAGLGSGLAKNPSWAKGFTGSNVGGLIVAAYGPGRSEHMGSFAPSSCEFQILKAKPHFELMDTFQGLGNYCKYDSRFVSLSTWENIY